MSRSPILYAEAGGPPADWNGLLVFDRATGAAVSFVTLVDVRRRVLRRLVREGGQFVIGPDGRAMQEMLRGDFLIVRRGSAEAHEALATWSARLGERIAAMEARHATA